MDDFSSLKAFLLIIGNARSGSTVLGSIINAHPNALIANETQLSGNLWNSATRESVLQTIASQAIQPNPGKILPSGYKFQFCKDSPKTDQVLLIGEKAWNPATLFLHGKYSLLTDLSTQMQLPLLILHAVRNPFDTISTMHIRSGAPIHDRIRWFFMHCEAVQAISDRYTSQSFKHVYHEALLLNPIVEIRSLMNFLSLPLIDSYIETIKNALFTFPNESSKKVVWSKEDRQEVLSRMEQFEFLKFYLQAKNQL